MIEDTLPKSNVPDWEKKYTICSGVMMFDSVLKDRELGVNRDEIYSFMEEFRKKFPNFLYYAIRYGNGEQKVHLDFCYLVERGEDSASKMNNFHYFYKKNFQNEILKRFGSALAGYDVSFGARGVFVNTNLLNSNQNK